MKLFEPMLYLAHQNCNNTFSLHLVHGTTGKFCLVLINFDFVLWNRQLQLQDGRPSRAEQKLWKVLKKKSGKSDRDDDNNDYDDVDHDDDGDDAIQLQR